MNVRRRIVVGSRGSKLALVQAECVAAKIREVNTNIEVSIEPVVTKGDRNRHMQLDHMEGIGVFVKELEEALLDGKIDVAVHSLKDVPTQIPQGLCLAAVTKRLDPRDVLASRMERLAELAPGSRIGTGSLRRVVQLAVNCPGLEPCNIRGNVDTRLRKVADGELDGVILAASALKRLGLEDRISEYLPVEHFLPAVGQGALAIEMRLGDKDIAELISPINHLPTWQGTSAERAFLSALGGGCRAPIAALGVMNGATLKLEGMVADSSLKKMLHASEESSTSSPEQLGVGLAQKLLSMGGAEFTAEVRGK